jgi:hypothetical protein
MSRLDLAPSAWLEATLDGGGESFTDISLSRQEVSLDKLFIIGDLTRRGQFKDTSIRPLYSHPCDSPEIEISTLISAPKHLCGVSSLMKKKLH